MNKMTDHIPVIETERLRLRAPQRDDLEVMTAFYQTERSYIVGGPLTPEETFRSLTSRIGHWAILGYGLWHIDAKKSGTFIGWTGILNPPSWDEPEIGWTLFEEAEGKGFAFEAANAARAYAARHQNLKGLISYIRADNHRSLALAKKLGATYERDGMVLDTPCQVYRHPKEAA